MTVPDFKTMTQDEIAEWVQNNDLTALIAAGVGEPARLPSSFEVLSVQESLALEAEQAGTRVVTVRLPKSMIEQLDDAAGNDREGRSGVVREAIRRYFDAPHAA